MAPVTMSLAIEPQGEARGRATSVGGHARIYTPAKTRAYRAQLAMLASPHRPAAPLLGPLRVEIVAVFSRPQRMQRLSKRTGEVLGGYSAAECPHTAKPDADNVAKAVLDALAPWWGDDAQVADLRVVKRYVAIGESARLDVRIGRVE